jgi:hypothetical protein
MSIVHISEDLKQEFAIDSQGKVTVSIRGAARLLEIDESSLRKNCRAGQNASTLAELLTEHGVDPAGLSENGITDVALAIVAKYYAYKAQKKSKQAEKFDMAMSAIGIRTWIQSELGYESQKRSTQAESKPEAPSLFQLDKLQLRSLWLCVALREQYNQEVEDPNLLQGIDPLFWDMPLLAIEGVMNQLVFAREHHLFAARNQYYRAKLGNHKDLNPVLSEISGNLDDANYWRLEPESVKAMNDFSIQLTRRFNRSQKKAQALTASKN